MIATEETTRIRFRDPPRCAQCGRRARSHEVGGPIHQGFSLYRSPMVAYVPWNKTFAGPSGFIGPWAKRGDGPLGFKGDFVGEATLVRQLCGDCRPRRT